MTAGALHLRQSIRSTKRTNWPLLIELAVRVAALSLAVAVMAYGLMVTV